MQNHLLGVGQALGNAIKQKMSSPLAVISHGKTIVQPGVEPIHIVNCYVEANHTTYGKKTLGYIYYVIRDCILKQD